MKGFSLIELMVVVVIIGILATVGVPQYQKFQMKAKRSEVKSLLGGMYTAQKAFFAEWTRYYADFNAVGYGVDGDLGYLVGFKNAGVVGPFTHPRAKYKAKPALIFNAMTYCQNKGCKVKAGVNLGHLPTSTTTKDASGTFKFTFGATANLDSDTTKDQWTINELRQLVIVTDDIAVGTD